MRNMKMTFGEWECLVVFRRYHDGNPAILLIDANDYQPVATATVNADIPPPDGTVFVKDWSENEGMLEALIAANVIHPEPVGFVPLGFVTAGAYCLTDEALRYQAAAEVQS